MKPTTKSPSISLARRRLLAASLSVLLGAGPLLAQSGGAGGSGSGGAGSGNYGSQPAGSSGTTSTTGTSASENARRNSQRDTAGAGATATTGSSTTGDPAGGPTTMTGRTQAGGGNERLDWGDRRFVTKAADSGMTELHMAQLAAQQASNPEVRSFAQRLVKDHTLVSQELLRMANDRNVKLDREDFKQDRSYRRLSQLSGMEFDQEFVEQMVEMHEDDVKRFERAARDADDEAVRSFASKHVDHLRQHLQQAQSLRQSIMPTGRDQRSSDSSDRSTTTDSSRATDASTHSDTDTSGSSTKSGTSGSSSGTRSPSNAGSR